MKKILFLFVFLAMTLSCQNNSKKHPKELQKIFDTHGKIEIWKNIKTISFTIDKETFTIDLTSKKKVVNGLNYSVGFDGKNYWFSEKSPIKNPKKYLEEITQIILTPFFLADLQNIEIDKKNSIIKFENKELFFDSKTFKIQQLKAGKSIIFYEKWQEKLGFFLPKEITMGRKKIVLKRLQLSQAIFDDRFYQNPNKTNPY